MDNSSARHSPVPPAPPVPPAMPLEMPLQDLKRWHGKRARRAAFATVLSRVLTFGGAVALAAYAYQEMLGVVSVGGVTLLQRVMLVLFTIAFAWIGLTATAAIAGIFFGGVRRKRGLHVAHDAERGDRAWRTALVMPICNERPAKSFAALEAMANSLIAEHEADGFEIFVLSDTRLPHIWAEETAAFQALRDALGERMRVWYRRRPVNAGRKAGNLHEFVSRYGGRYDFMVVLDADSLMAPQTLATLVREMGADPGLGLLQTVPRLCGGETLFARLQQFAGAIYGPIVARGISAWQGDDGNYWGHNAIIRVRAFAAAAGLPELPGRKPFGGTIMSHDFVEAALLRRAGWAVRMLPTLGGSWEDSPPTLLDVAVRDRRWAQGNLQHLGVIGARGLTWPSRMHLAIGVMSYLASPIWLALMGVGLVIAVRAANVPFDYFPDDATLFPRWPLFDSEGMIRLFLLAMATLLLPKALGLVRALCSREMLRTVGPIRLVLGVAAEIVLSALYAPISMLMQTRQVWEILRGRDSGWATQSRQRAAVAWRVVLARHWRHMVIGLVATALLLSYSPPLLAWMAPTLAGLVLAIPLSALSGSVWLARSLRFFGFLVTPEEARPPPVLALRDAAETRYSTAIEAVTLERLVADAGLRHRHLASLTPPPPAVRGAPDAVLLAARAKVADAVTAEEALAWLTPAEQVAVLGHAELLTALARLERGGAGEPATSLKRA